MSDGGRSGGRYHSPVAQRHSSQSSPAPDQPSPQRQVRWGTPQIHSHPAIDPDEEVEVMQDSSGEDEMGDELIPEDLSYNTVMAITATKARVGMCLYDQSEHKLFFIEDQQDSEQFDLVRLIIDQTKPDKIYTNIAADVGLIELLDQLMGQLHPESSYASMGALVEHHPKKDFLASKGRQMLQTVHIIEGGAYQASWSREGTSQIGIEDQSGDDGTAEPVMKKPRRGYGPVGVETLSADQARRNQALKVDNFLNSIESSQLTLGCAGVLLTNLSGLLRTNYDRDGGADLKVSGLQLLHLDRVMQVGSDALSSLDIFAEEDHASVYSTAKREGTSLFGVTDLTKTPAGQAKLRQWFTRPSLELDVIKQRQDLIECLLLQDNYGPVGLMRGELRQVKNPLRLVKIISQFSATYKDWKALASFALAAVKIVGAAKSLIDLPNSDLKGRIHAIDHEAIKELGDNIVAVIDFNDSALQKGGRVIVHTGVSDELDEYKRRKAGLTDMLTKLAEAVSENLPSEFGEELDIMYLPQIGYLFRVPTKEGMQDPLSYYGIEGWTFVFTDQEHTYFKTDQCRQIDSNVGDIQTFITDREVEIIHILSGEVIEREDVIKHACEVIAELDCLLALAMTARANQWIRPVVVEEPVLKIKNGRHPLVGRFVDSFIPNSTILIGGKGAGPDATQAETSEPKAEDQGRGGGMRTDSIMIVTGANYSGKSVHLKAVALITFLAHIGSFVPAEKAVVGLTDRILTRLTTRESISRASSAFMLDLQQVSFVLRNVTERSLVVLDELGKGTEAHDGAGVFCGVINHLVQRGSKTPRTIASTHFQTVFRRGLLSSSLPINVAHMEVIIPESLNISDNIASNNSTYRHSASSSNEITYLYALRPGLAQGSQAGACARLFGIEEDIVQEANKVSSFLNKFELEGFLAGAEEGEEGTKEEFEEGERIARRMLLWEPPKEGEREKSVAETLLEGRRVLGEVGLESKEWSGEVS